MRIENYCHIPDLRRNLGIITGFTASYILQLYGSFISMEITRHIEPVLNRTKVEISYGINHVVDYLYIFFTTTSFLIYKENGCHQDIFQVMIELFLIELANGILFGFY